MPNDSRHLLITGLVRNCARSVRADVERLQRAVAGNGSVQWLLVESDSTDATLAVLDELRREVEGFDHVSLGSLQASIPMRTDRIARCRNEYLQRLRDDPRYRDVQYVLVADFDGINTLIDAEGIRSCWQRDDWDVCTANQRGPYYDVWALRHPVWSPNDCWDQYAFLARFCDVREVLLFRTLHARMVRIPPTSPWIEVDSAFGGLALYRREALAGAAYAGTDGQGRMVCEHVVLHQALRAAGRRIFVNPALINAGWTEHSRELKWYRRIDRLLRNAVTSWRSLKPAAPPRGWAADS